MPKAAIVIRTFNEERHLGRLLDALDSQTFRDFEVVLVDSGSTDGTLGIAAARVGTIVRLDSRDFTFGYSLNQGIAASAAEIAVIVSAHTRPVTDEWLRELVLPFERDEVAMVYGGQRGVAESRYSERRDFERTYADSVRTHRAPDFFANNANSAVRRSLWAEHPFDERLPGLEDIAWARYWVARGKEVVYQPAATIYHIHDESWAQIRNRYYREAVAARRIGVRSRKDALPDALLEVWYGAADLASAWRGGELGARAGEIVRYRYNKAKGHVRGLLDTETKQDRIVTASYFDRAHRAVVVRGPGHVSVERVPLPTAKPGDVLIKVAFAGICGTDVEIVDGTLGYYADGTASYPITPGHEFSGRVVSAGANAGAWRAGTPVVVECIQGCGTCASCQANNAIGCARRAEVGVIGRDGGFAEYISVPHRFVRPLPPLTSLRNAVLCEPIAVVLKGLRRLDHVLTTSAGGSRPRCAIVGGGPIGLIAANVLRARGHDVLLIEREPSRRGLFAPSVGQISAVKDYPVVVEATGHPGALDEVLHHSRAGSSILLLGFPYATQPLNWESIVAYDKTIVGSVGSTRDDFEAAIRLLPSLSLGALLEHRMPLDDFPEALAAARSRKHPKIVLDVDPTLENAPDVRGLTSRADPRPQRVRTA